MPMLESILVADPDADSRAILRAFYESRQVTVHEVDGVMCAHAARRARPDLVILALGKNYRTGLRTVARLRANPRTASIPVVVFSAAALPHALDEARALGCALAVSKPLTPSELHAQIEAALVAG